MKKEKRGSKRQKIRIPILVWELEGGKPVGEVFEASSKDLSETGLSFESSKVFRINSRLLVEIHVPGRKVPLSVQMKVTRIESVLDKDTYLIGSTFVELKEEDRDLIVSCLKKTNLYKILDHALKRGASDLHLTVGQSPVVRRQGRIELLNEPKLEEGHIRAMIYPLLNAAQIESFEKNKELDFAFSPNLESRFRVNVHMQKGFVEATLRSVPTHTKEFEDLGLPAKVLQEFCSKKAGLFLIAGTTGSGKTTTLASMVDYINKNLERVVITVEDPVEFMHASQKSVVKQRELGSDTYSYSEALKRALRQDPDVIVVGELMDSECVHAALRAAETGHLVISTIHAPDTEQVIERLVNLFPPEHAAHICQQLASCLEGAMYQTLIPSRNGGRVLATELMVANYAIKNMIRERRYNQISMSIQTGRKSGMHTLQSSLEKLSQEGKIKPGALKEFEKVNQ